MMYVEKAPNVLCLQLNRLDYQDNEMIKHKHKVAIDETIYVDRYLAKNKELSSKLKQQAQELRDQIKSLDQAISNYTNFNGKEYDVRQIFALAGAFFDQQTASDKN